MTWHISCLFSEDDNFAPELQPGDNQLTVPFQTQGAYPAYAASIIETFDAFGLTPSVEANDLLNAAIGAYIADLRVPRGENEDGWTREFVLHIAVHDVERWSDCIEIFEELLSFLTGDYWTVSLRRLIIASNSSRTSRAKAKPQTHTVSTALPPGRSTKNCMTLLPQKYAPPWGCQQAPIFGITSPNWG